MDSPQTPSPLRVVAPPTPAAAAAPLQDEPYRPCPSSTGFAPSTPAPQAGCTLVPIETVIQVIHNDSETQRLAVCRVEAFDRTYLVIRQQEWGPGIGWFNQRSIEIEADQLGPLRGTLQSCKDCCKASSSKRSVAESANRQGLRVVS